MKQKLWRIVSCALTLCLLAVSLSFLTNLTEGKDSIKNYQPFFEQESNFDVLFMGTSHVIFGVFPMELWNDYGIVSYNIGGHANELATTYWVMENALNYTTPKLVIVDCFMLEENTKTYDKFSYAHRSLDVFPLSAYKIKAILDLLDDPAMSEKIENGTVVESEKRTPIGLLWDFSVYHSRWNELGQDDFQPVVTSEKGAEYTHIAVAVPQDFPKIDRNEKLTEDTVAIKYLNKIIESCQERGIDVLLTYIPFPAKEDLQKEANRVYDIAAEYGVNYINFLDMGVVNYDTDCFDSGSHLNPSGARKVTDYLGKYIIEHYQIPDQRNNPEYSGWFEDYEEYKALKASYLKAQKRWDTYLMLLADKNLDVIVEVQNPELWSDNTFVNLVKNLGVDVSGISDTANYLVIRGRDAQAETLSLDVEADTQTDTAMGRLRILHDGSGAYSVYLDDTACFLPGRDNGGNLRIYARDSETLEPVGQVVF